MSEQAHILIIEDEDLVRRELRECFESGGYTVMEADDCASAQAMLAVHKFDLITVDVKLKIKNAPPETPPDDGAKLAREIRRDHSDCGILAVSVDGDKPEHLDWLRTWADDSIPKPFRDEEVLARTEAILRRSRRQNGGDQQNGVGRGSYGHFTNWVLNTKRHQLIAPDGRVEDLRQAEFSLLMLLLKHPREVLSRERIFELDPHIRAMGVQDIRGPVDMRVYRLRGRFGREIGDDIIKTFRGMGYVLEADVVWSDERVLP